MLDKKSTRIRKAASVLSREDLRAKRKLSEHSRRATLKKTQKDRARKAMLIGEAIMREIDRGNWDMTALKELLDSYISRREDRILFDL